MKLFELMKQKELGSAPDTLFGYRITILKRETYGSDSAIIITAENKLKELFICYEGNEVWYHRSIEREDLMLKSYYNNYTYYLPNLFLKTHGYDFDDKVYTRREGAPPINEEDIKEKCIRFLKITGETQLIKEIK